MPKTLDHQTLEGDLTLLHPTGSDGAGARKRSILLQGKTLAGTLHTLAAIVAQHEGAAADQKGELVVYLNDGGDGTSPTEALRIGSAGVVTFAATPTGLLTAAAAAAAYQPLDADLTAIAALTTTAYGRALLALADAAALRTAAGLGTMAVEAATSYLAKALGTTKGDIAVWTASGAVDRLAAGADGTMLQAFAGATAGLRFAGAPACFQFGRSAVGSGASNLAMGFANATDGCLIVPSGWKLACVAKAGFSPATTANVPSIAMRVDDVDVSASWGGALALPASTTDAKASAEPSSPPYIVDASGGDKRVDFIVSTTAAGGGNANIAAMLYGYPFKAT